VKRNIEVETQVRGFVDELWLVKDNLSLNGGSDAEGWH